MENEKIEQLQKQFSKVYLDTTKHCQDIEKWIKSGKRKQGDIRRSLNRLTIKYQKLCELNTELEKNSTIGQEESTNIANYKKQVNLVQIKSKIEYLYDLAGLSKQNQSIYSNNVELINDISVQPNTQIKEHVTPIYNKDIELINDIIKEEPNSLKIKKEEGLFDKIKQKIQSKINNFKKSKKNNAKNKRSLTKRIVALGMALTMGVFSSATPGGDVTKTDNNKNDKSYTDSNREKNDFKKSIYIKALENTETASKNVNMNIEKQKAQQKKEKEDIEKIFLATANTKYTEVSDGSGKKGYLTEDTKVKIYNRAIVKTNENGSKTIVEATKVGQTWEDLSKETGVDYEEYMKNNKNAQECVSIQDEKTLYGWVSIDELEEIEVENMEEMER